MVRMRPQRAGGRFQAPGRLPGSCNTATARLFGGRDATDRCPAELDGASGARGGKAIR